jgi:hypothetical protein
MRSENLLDQRTARARQAHQKNHFPPLRTALRNLGLVEGGANCPDAIGESRAVPRVANAFNRVGALEHGERRRKFARILQHLAVSEVQQLPIGYREHRPLCGRLQLLAFTRVQGHSFEINQRKPGARYFTIKTDQRAAVIRRSLGIAQCLMAARALQQGDRRMAIQS